MPADSISHLDSSDAAQSEHSRQRVIALSVVIVFCTAACVLVGWQFRIDWLKTPFSDKAFMVPNTALCFLLSALSLWTQRTEDSRARRLSFGRACAAVTTILGFLFLAEGTFRIDLVGIDRIFFHHRLQAQVGGWPVGRPALNTALAFFLLGSSLLLKGRKFRSWHYSEVLCMPALLIGFLGTAGYSLGAHALFQAFPALTPMSIYTTFLVCVLSAGVVFADPKHRLCDLLLSREAGGVLARRLLTAAILTLLFFGWLDLALSERQLVDLHLGTAILVVAATSVLAATVVWTATLLNRDSAARRIIECELRQGKREWEQTFNSVPDLIAVLDKQHRIVRINQAMAQRLGTVPEACVGLNCFNCVHAASAPPSFCPHALTLRDFKEHLAEVHEERLGGDFLVSTTPVFDDKGELTGAVHVARDITERKRAEELLHKLNRTLQALSKSGQAVLHATTEDALLQQVCKIVTEDCGYAMVWIGFAEDDQDKTVRPVAHAGAEQGYLERLHITWADNEHGRGPTGLAIRTGQPCSCRDMLTDPRFEPWRAEAIQRGYASSLVLPLMEDGRAFGAITIYSREPDAFFEDEVKLLLDLTANIAYGISMIRIRAARERAEEELRQNRQWLSVTLNSIGDAVIACDTAGRITFLNPVASALTGWSPEEAQGQPVQNVFRIVNEVSRLAAEDIVARVLQEGHVVELANHTALLARDDREIPIEDSAAPIMDVTGKLIGVVLVFHDVAEKRRAADALQEARLQAERTAAQLRTILDNMTERLYVCDREGNVILVNEAARRSYGPDKKAVAPPVFDMAGHAEGFGLDGRRLPFFDWPISRVLRGEHVHSAEIRLRFKATGEERILSCNGAPVRDQNGAIEMAVLTSEDITERKRFEARLHRFFETDLFAILYWKIDGGVIDVNDKFLEMTGYMREDLQAGRLNWAQMTPPEYHAMDEDARRQIRETGVHLPYEKEYIRKDGTRVWGLFAAAAWQDSRDEGVSFIIDIDARKRAESAIVRRNATLYGINEILNAALTCQTEEDLGRSCLNVCERITQSKFGFIGEIGTDGMLHDIAISDPGWELCTMLDQTGHRRPPGNFKIHGIYGRVLSDGKGLFTNDPASHPDSFGLPSGHPPLRSFLGIPLVRDKCIIGMIALGNRVGGYSRVEQQILEELTPAVVEAFARKRAEEALQESEARFRSVLEDSRDLIYRVNLETGKYEYVSPSSEAVVGFSPEEYTTQDVETAFAMIHPEDLPAMMDALAQLKQTGAADVEYRYGAKSREYRWLSNRMSLGRDGAGRPIYRDGYIRDITERKKSERALVQSEKLASVGRMASTIAHEINNPLETIGQAVYLAATDPDASKQAKSYLDMATQELERVSHITRQTLAFHRESTTIKAIDLRESMDGVLKLFDARFKTRKIQVEQRYHTDIRVQANDGELRQIISNLITNGMDAMPHGGRICIGVSCTGQANGGCGVRLTVADTGIGIAPEQKKKIFEAFFTTKEVVGTGLGLWITKQILEKYRATIRVRSKLGQGTVFSILFPVAPTTDSNGAN